MAWRESPAGRHIELGIAEHNLFLLLGALGLTAELSGTTLLPIGTLYDPFVPRGLDALYHALYAGGRFVVAATPSGVTLSPEGGAHQSVITPSIGVALPAIAYFEPAFAREVEWILLDGLPAIAARGGESLYLRLSTRHVSQALAPATTPEYRDAVLRGGYRLSDARDRSGYAADRAVHLFAAGVMVTEALEAARALAGHGVFANVFVVTSPDRLYRGLRAPRPWLETLVAADEEDVPVVSVLDGHSHALGFIGGALGVPQQALGVEDFGQSGARADLYRHYGIDAAAIALDAAERTALSALGVDWSLEAWGIDDATRAAWLRLAADHAAADLEGFIERRRRSGDARQRAALLRALPLLPDAQQWLAVALEARRGDVRAVLEALVCDNPYPATHFHEVHFDDLVLAALEADLPLARMVGLGARVTERLATAAARVAATRRASGRRPPADLWRLVWGVA